MSKPLAMIIEDDVEIAKIFTIALKSDFEVEMFADGHSGLARLAHVIPVLIVLDLHLPELSGMEIFSRIRADARLDGTKIILCTADALGGEMLHSQADLVLLKPVSPGQLRELASRMINPSG